MGSSPSVRVSCVQTILSFAKVVWTLSVHVELLLTEAECMCKAELYENPTEKIHRYRNIFKNKGRGKHWKVNICTVRKHCLAENTFDTRKGLELTWSFLMVSPNFKTWKIFSFPSCSVGFPCASSSTFTSTSVSDCWNDLNRCLIEIWQFH